MCLVCFELVNPKLAITCYNKKCIVKMCFDCATTYIDVCKKEKMPCKCINTSCKAEYLYSEVKKIGPGVLNTYNELIQTYIENLYSNQKYSHQNELFVIEKFKRERMVFLEEKIPKNIVYVINNVLQDKLKKLDKSNKKIQDNAKKSSNMKCFRLTCKGFLDDNFKCDICDVCFCKDCEKQVTEKHICLKEDLETKNFMKSLVKCPTCDIPVLKQDGCNQMTCSICKTNFDYVSGVKTSLGSHVKQDATLKEKKLSIVYKDMIQEDLIFLILRFESIKIKTFDVSKFYTKDLKDISKLYETYTRSICYNKELSVYGNIIENEIIQKTLTKDLLFEILNDLR
jgi:hypothetical protein